ncbi:MAG: toll/interleukin-1 receptor domain-containing protein [Chloroflexi bacterium]|nr:toll/interleukin-1 receptor domain-containing protein [Chloroflexota bacterium]
MAKRLWLTYAHADNVTGDVDNIDAELRRIGVDVHRDVWDLLAGIPLWDQIGAAITDPARCDGWMVFATQTSLESPKCIEELWYALDRALERRGTRFPLIALCPSTVDPNVLPPALRVRLALSLADPSWATRTKQALEGRPHRPEISVDPYEVAPHESPDGRVVLEIRPRSGSWAPCYVAIPASEERVVRPSLYFGPRGSPPKNATLYQYRRGLGGTENEWLVMQASNEATPTQSYYLRCDAYPSRISFGVLGGKPFYVVKFERPAR